MKFNYLRPNPRGFTLVEVIVVVAIMVVLAGLGIGSFQFVQKGQRQKQAKIQIEQMQSALAEYKLDSGALIPASGGQQSSVEIYRMVSGDPNTDGQLDNNAKAYIPNMMAGGQRKGYQIGQNFAIMDPYGSPYRYQFPGQRNPPTEPDIWSAGPDGVDNTADDITNW